MFRTVTIKEKGSGMKSLLNLDNGKFLSIIIVMLVIYVTWYTQSSSLLLTKKIDNLETVMQISDVGIRSDIKHLNSDQKEIEKSNTGLQREIDKMLIIQQVSSAWETEEETTRKIIKEIMVEYQVKEKANGS